jgi:redox-sensitive bicupin YhaK (pirin superfamily)
VNASQDRGVHFLQIWMLPSSAGIDPGYEQKHFPEADKRGRLRLVASPDGRDGSVTVHTDARLHAGLFTEGESATHTLAPGRHAWIHIAKGRARVNGTELTAGDALALSDEPSAHIEGLADAEILVFDLP